MNNYTLSARLIAGALLTLASWHFISQLFSIFAWVSVAERISKTHVQLTYFLLVALTIFALVIAFLGLYLLIPGIKELRNQK